MISYKFKLHAKAKRDGFIGNKITRHLMLYNRIVELGERYYKRYGKILRSKTLNKYISMKKSDPSWSYILEGLNAWAVQETVKRRDWAFDRFFKYLKRQQQNPHTMPIESPPRKHNIHGEGSYKLTQGGGWKLIDGGIATGRMWNNFGIPKDIHTYKFFGNRNIEGKAKNAVFKRDRCGDIWCSITTDHTISKPLPKTGKIGGFDYSQEHFFVSDDGRFWDIDGCKEEEVKASKLRRRFDKTVRGSNNRKRIHEELARVTRKIARKRRSQHYELAWRLCREYDVMCFEDNDYVEMYSRKRIVNGHRVTTKQRRRLRDLSPASFLVILKEVAKKTGKTVFMVDRYYASSQVCSGCGYKNVALKNLKVRKWKCPKCGEMHDRDINAAKNLVKEFERTVGEASSIETKTDTKPKGESYWERIRKSASVKRAAGAGEKSPCPQGRGVPPKSGTAAVCRELYTDACTVEEEKATTQNKKEEGIPKVRNDKVETKAKGTIYDLCFRQIKAMTSPLASGYDDSRKIGFELWKRLKPILLRLSEEMKTESEFKGFSVWILDDMPYDYVLCESINKKTGELGIRVGLRSRGVFIDETFYLPKGVETMDWDDILAYALKNDAMVQPRKAVASAFFSR